MFRRGLTLSLVLGMAAMVQAGAHIELVPTGGGGGVGPFAPCDATGSGFGLGQVVTVDVMLTQTPIGNDEFLRMIQLDFAASDAALGSPSAEVWMATVNHFAYSVDSRRSNTYFGDLTTPDLGLNMTDQFLIRGGGTAIKVGQFDITMPGAPGSYTLDVLNSGDADADRGGQIRFGYGLAGTSPLTTWRGADLTGGSFTFDVGAGGGTTAIVASPEMDRSLWRSSKQVVRIEFDNDIVAPVAGEVEIRELLAGNTFGPDLSASFDFSVENPGVGPRVLRIADTGANLDHRSWYTMRNTGSWAGVSPFRVHYIVQFGDANGDLRVQFSDLAFINASVGLDVADDNRSDINGDGRVQFSDLAAANTGVGSSIVAKPSGHDCP